MNQSAPIAVTGAVLPTRVIRPHLARARLTSAAPFLLVLALAALLRLAWLGHAPLWGDEAATAGFASLPWSELLAGIGRLEPNPPTFYIAEHLWTALAGSSDVALRLPSALCGIAGVALVWRLTRLAFGPAAALWAALLLATSSHHLEHSRDARVYAALLLVTAAAALAARTIATTASPRARTGARTGASIDASTDARTGAAFAPAIALALLAGAALWLHATGPIAMAATFAYAGVLALHRPGPRARRLATLGAAGLAGLLLGAPSLLPLLAVSADKTNNAAWIPVPDAFMAVMFTINTWAAPYAGLRLFPVPVTLAGLALGALVVAHPLVWAATCARRSPDAAALLAAALTAILLTAGISQFVPIMVEKTLLFSLVFFIPLLGATLAALPLPWRAALLILIALLQAPGLWTVLAGPRHGEDWATLAATLQPEARSGWAVIVRSGFDAVSLERYLPAADPARPRISITPRIGTELNRQTALLMSGANSIPEQATPAQLCAALGPHRGVLLIDRDNHVLERERQPALALLRAAGGTLADTATVGSLIIQRWPGACASPAPTGGP